MYFVTVRTNNETFDRGLNVQDEATARARRAERALAAPRNSTVSLYRVTSTFPVLIEEGSGG